ncbi:WD40/YVTN/BNR-like repeat-containing protein [Spartinivicinus poritis]|uniref:YCF48-related protein n=1 Tax=Spartinivicinus poritis TaxID=2994640 RepID=A0ABT5U6L9_9GAMM|nr:YCF48-related protein [Spartinivicinus sp. A2-2]MDE1461202.1 YCF48-related protein [Spartinivicinus sp. A2-2]
MRFAARQRRFARLNRWPALNALLKAGLLILLLTNAFKLYADNKITDPPAVLSDKAAQALLLDITIPPGSQRLVAVGERGHIVYSDNQGQQWQQAKVPTSQLVTAIHFVDQHHGWAVGHDSIILATTDGGTSWQRQYDDLAMEAPLLDVWFFNQQVGFAVGAYGQILRTTDGGNRWEDWSHTIENEEEFHYNSITAIDNDRLIIVGEAGLLYRSTNKGKTWELLESPYEGSLFGTIATGTADSALIFGLRGHIFRTNDFGDSWQQVKVKTEQGLYGGQLSSDQQITLVGNAGVVLVSKDAGLSFQVVQRPDRKALSNVVSLADQKLVLVGEGGIKLASPLGKPLETN